MADRDLRHAGFEIPNIRHGEWPQWVWLGDRGAFMRWEKDGLHHNAQWSTTAGLHVYTDELHMSCLRVVCPWAEAKEIVRKIRNEQ